MKICPSCQSQNEDSELFCGNCGTKLDEANTPEPEIQEIPAPSDAVPPAFDPLQPPVAAAPAKPPKKKKNKLAIAFIIAVFVFVVAVAISESSGSGGSSDSGKPDSKPQVTTENSDENNNNADGTGNNDSGNSSATQDNSDIKAAPAGTTQFKNDDLSYVLVYNPALYDERNQYDTTALKTGDFSAAQIDINSDRADSDDATEYTMNTISQNFWLNDLGDHKIETESSKAGLDGTAYTLGSKQTFFHASDYSLDVRMESEFECVYAGTYCYIWVNDVANNVNIEKLGKEFDQTIYPNCTNKFGEPRFVSPDGGKVNILIYDLQPYLCGYVRAGEVYSKSELSPSNIQYLENLKINTDHAIIHINSDFSKNTSLFNSTCSTMTHEFQHYIYYCNAMDSVSASWLNEAISGYIEEQLYPGGKESEGHFSAFEESALIRGGQSLYNFNNNVYDIGVYGSVYYYTEFLKKLTDNDSVFSEIHNYWIGLTNGTESEAVYDAVNKTNAAKISEVDSLIAYPDSISFSSTEDEWMSKLTLNYYLSFLSDSLAIPNRSEVDTSYLVYDNLSGADIEGGGRIILSVKNGEFNIPADAESGLIYIGLDSDFNVVTDYIYK